MKKKSVIQILTVLLTAVLVVSGGRVAWKLLDYHRSGQSYSAAAETAGLPKRIETPQAAVSPQDKSQDDPPEPSWTEQLSALDLPALREINSEILGWIAIPDTELSYPLLQAPNNSYYLNHLWNHQRNSAGSIYLECKSAWDFSDFNTIIYGHRMRDTSMFGTLPLYKDQDFFQAHPSVYISDENGVRQYDIFAACEVGVREIIYRLDIDQPDEIQRLIQFSLDHSVIQTGVTPGVDDHIITLSTCTERGHATRWVVQAVLRDGEGEP